MDFKPTRKSLRQHQVPQWYHDAKFGIFIHWGLFSVPAFAPVCNRTIWEIAAREGVENQMKNNPYAEWYLNSMKIEGSPTREYHGKTYGEEFSYDNFAAIFKKEAEKWSPSEWAGLFKEAGARYVVMVTKHCDGFLLWPSKRLTPYREGYYSERDLVGELTQAVRSEGLRMGFYYIGGWDWTFQTAPILDPVGLITNGPVSKEYAEYADFHYRELIDNYRPDVLWNDICYPPKGDLFGLLAHYYNSVPEGVVNDRWMKHAKYGRKIMTFRPIRKLLNWIGNRLITSEGPPPPKPPHADFLTPEYASFNEIKTKKWESSRGIGYSYGYNRMETEEHYLKASEAIHMLVDIVSKNGNLLLNIGPRADGSIPEEQLKCIRGMGLWLQVNGEAIYGTRPWKRAEGRTACGVDIRFTRKGETLYAILLSNPTQPKINIPGLNIQSNSSIKLLDPETELSWHHEADKLVIDLPPKLPESPAHVMVFSKILKNP